jgi:hypothetical protein
VFEEKDEAFYVSIARDFSEKMLYINTGASIYPSIRVFFLLPLFSWAGCTVCMQLPSAFQSSVLSSPDCCPHTMQAPP